MVSVIIVACSLCLFLYMGLFVLNTFAIYVGEMTVFSLRVIVLL